MAASHSELLIRQRIAALRRALPLAREGNPGAIHQARVATRRLREAIPLVARGIAGRKLERTVRRLTRALGPVRELDVATQMLGELAASPDIPSGAVACLHQTIDDERGRLHNDLVRTIEKTNVAKLTKKAVAASRAGVDREAAPARDPRQAAAARQRAARRAETLRAAIENAAAIYLPDRLHDVRIAVKKLRYSLEIARELTRSRATARIMSLKRAQDLLGRMHDLEVLIARTRAVQGSTRAPSLRLSAELDTLVRSLEAECRQLHARYIASRSSLLAICEHVVATPAKRGRRAPAA